MARHKDLNWNLPSDSGRPNTHSWESIKVALLMDIRDELQEMNAVLHCPNFQRIPHYLRGIKTNTTKPKRKVKK